LEKEASAASQIGKEEAVQGQHKGVRNPAFEFILSLLTVVHCSMTKLAEAVANGTVTCVMCENKRISSSLQADLSLVINAASAEKSKITSMRFQARACSPVTF
jgi:hypothetical protein